MARPLNMASFAAVTAAIVGLGGTVDSTTYQGVSRQNIKAALPDVSAARLNGTVKKAVAGGKLVQDKGSHNLPKQAASEVAAAKSATTRQFGVTDVDSAVAASAFGAVAPRRPRSEADCDCPACSVRGGLSA